MRLRINKSAYQDILDTVGTYPCETGGLLLGNREDQYIEEFYFDQNGSETKVSYSPDVITLNRVIKEKRDDGLEFMGMVHSHPPYFKELSGLGGDLGYASDIFKAMPSLSYLVTPIMFSKSDCSKQEMIPYVIQKGELENYKPAQLELVEDDYIMDQSRIQGAVDFDLMQRIKIVVVGVGGASGLCESLVRTGAKNLVVCDFDKVDRSNLTTQGFTIDDIGEYKSDVLAARLLKINPEVQVQSITKDFTTLKKKQLKSVLKEADLLLMMTDSFKCQAFGNRLALNFGIPAIWAGMHDRARSCEVIFTIPGETPNCFRCFTKARYDFYSAGKVSDITSSRSTIFDTNYLNDIIGKTALAMIHRETDGFEYSDWLTKRIHSRNLIHSKLHPDYSTDKGSIFQRLFGRKKEFFTFVSAWRKAMSQEKNSCPDCDSTGNLEDSKNKFRFRELDRF